LRGNFRQARHTRSTRESSHAAGGAAPFDRCTERSWDTNDCRHPHPVGEAPRGVRTAALGRTTSLRSAWGLWSGAVIGGCWVGMGPSPAHMKRAHPSPWGPPWGAVRPVDPPASPNVSVPSPFPSVPRGSPVGPPLCPPACSRVLAPDRLPSVLSMVPRGGTLRGSLGRPSWISPPPAVERASGVPR